MANIQRLGNATVATQTAGSALADPWDVSHTIPTGTNFVLHITLGSWTNFPATQTGNFYDTVTLGTAGPSFSPKVFGQVNNGTKKIQVEIRGIFPSVTGAQTIRHNTTGGGNACIAYIINYSGINDLSTVFNVFTDSGLDSNSTDTPLVLAPTNVTAGDFQFVIAASFSETSAFSIDNGWSELFESASGANVNDITGAFYDTTAFTDDDATQNVTITNFDSRTIGFRYILEPRILLPSGSPSIPTPFSTSTTKRPPRVYLNTTQTKAGATELPVQSFNDAGTSLTFNDPQGAPTGSLFLGIENTSTRFIDWQAVTVNTGPIASGTPSIAAIEAAGNALRTTVTVTDVANSGETPGAGSETWNDGSSGNVISGSGFL